MGASATTSLAGLKNDHIEKYVPYLSQHVCQQSVNDCFNGVNTVD